MPLWAGGPGVHTCGCISEIKANLLYWECSFHWFKEEGMSQNSILVGFLSSAFPRNIIWRIKGCVLQTLSTRSLYLAVLIAHFLSFITGLNVLFRSASVYNPVRKLQI